MAKILVVDDETDLEMLIKQKFRQKIREHQYEFVFAINGNTCTGTIGTASRCGYCTQRYQYAGNGWADPAYQTE